MKIDPAIAVPLALLLGTAVGKAVALDPGWRAERAALAAERALQNDTEQLGLACSETEAAALRAQAAGWRSIVPLPGAAVAYGQGLVTEAAAATGWKTTFAPPVQADGFVTWKVQLQPGSNNTQPWRSLVALWEGLQRQHPQIGLTRMAVRADEQGRYSAEGTLRLPYLLPNEEISQ